MSDTINIKDAVLGVKYRSSVTFPKTVAAPIENVRLADLDINTVYQRLLNGPHSKRIHREFDPKYFGVPVICRRKHENGALVIVDGYQRIGAAYAGGVRDADCQVIDSHSDAEEADIFLRFNKSRKQVPSPVIARAEKITGDKRATILVNAIERAGFTLSEKGGNLKVKAVTAFSSNNNSGAINRYGAENLTNALLAWKATWPSHDEVNANTVRGLMFLIWFTRNNGAPQTVTAAKLAEKLAHVPWEVINANASVRLVHHADRDYAYALELIKVYNKKAKGRSALSPTDAHDAWMGMKK